jgi:hypothetical protein
MKRWTLLLLGLAACNSSSGESGALTISRHGITYQFPKRDLNAVVIPPDGRLFVRLEPPGTKFHLILDDWSDRPSNHGPAIPRISRLSDNRFGKFSLVQAEGGPLVCDQGPQPHYNCGFLITDGPNRWAVLFDRDQMPRAGKIRAGAQAAIRAYRR